MNKKILIITLVGILESAASWSAQTARVDTPETMVYSIPNEKDARVVKVLSKGAPLAVSNVPTEGYFKVRTSDGTVGWVKATDLLLFGVPE